MSEKLPEIPTPETKVTDGTDIFSEMDNNRCPICHIDLVSKTHDQWLRSYGGTELWVTDVHFLSCPKCSSTIYPTETLDYFERARAGEIPNLKSRIYEPDQYDD